jgi:hypothetical protein
MIAVWLRKRKPPSDSSPMKSKERMVFISIDKAIEVSSKPEHLEELNVVWHKEV